MKCWIEINKSALKHNFNIFSQLVGKDNLAPVLKSNAYGHGLAEVSKILSDEGVVTLCVNYLFEAELIRKEGFVGKVLLLGTLTDKDEFIRAKRLDVQVIISSVAVFKLWSSLENMPDVFLKIETGLTRRGLSLEGLSEVANEVSPKNKSLLGVMTHFADVEEAARLDFSRRQLRLLGSARDFLYNKGFKNLKCHSASSASSLLLEDSRKDLCRIGISIYGLWPSTLNKNSYLLCKESSEAFELMPVLSWKTRVYDIQKVKKGASIGYGCTYVAKDERLIGVIPVGYYEGLPRIVSNKSAYVIVHGKRCHILGRVCMNMSIIDLSPVFGEVRSGDLVTIIGKNGNEEMTVEKLAGWSDTIHYEFITRLNAEIPRYVV